MHHPVEGFKNNPHFVLSLGYSLILHTLFGAVILSSFPAPSLSIDRPLADYMMVMLTDKTEAIKQPDKPKVRTKKPKPIAIKQAKPLPKQPEPPTPPPQEEPTTPPVGATPPPASQPLPESEAVVTLVPAPEPVVPVQQQEASLLPEEPEPLVEAPPPPPEAVSPIEEPTPLPLTQEVVSSPVPTPEPPPLVAEAADSPPSEPSTAVSETKEAEPQDRPEREVHALREEFISEERVSIIVPPVIIVTEPQAGTVLDATRGITIRGTIDDPGIKAATVILNGARVEVEIHEGRFETMLSDAAANENMLFVEATNAAGLTGQSALVRFSTVRPDPKDLLVILSCKASCADVKLTALKGEHPQSKGYLPFKPPLEIDSSTVEYQNSSPYLARLMAISKTDSGVYTVRLDSHPSQIAQDCDPHLVVILYGYSSDKLRARVFRPSASSGGQGPWILARFLMPQGFFWDDDWNTGQIEDSRSMTKFNSSLGIVWKTLK